MLRKKSLVSFTAMRFEKRIEAVASQASKPASKAKSSTQRAKALYTTQSEGQMHSGGATKP